jgi:hypothetical protein
MPRLLCARERPSGKIPTRAKGNGQMSEPTKEYWQAKAQLCEKVALDQLMNADTAGAMKNLERMVYALSRVGITNEREGKDNG